jgi:hypothetical protein
MNDEPNPYDVAGMRKYVAEHKGERRGTSQPIEFERLQRENAHV